MPKAPAAYRVVITTLREDGLDAVISLDLDRRKLVQAMNALRDEGDPLYRILRDHLAATAKRRGPPIQVNTTRAFEHRPGRVVAQVRVDELVGPKGLIQIDRRDGMVILRPAKVTQ